MSDQKVTLKDLRAKVKELRAANIGVPLSRAKLEDLQKEMEYHAAAARQREMAQKRAEAVAARKAAKAAGVKVAPTKEEAKVEAKTNRKPSKKNKDAGESVA